MAQVVGGRVRGRPEPDQAAAAAVPNGPEATPERVRYIPGLDGLRALAVLAVMFDHMTYKSPHIVPRWQPGGWLAVSSFFTLSGFLITLLLIVEYGNRKTVALGSFWERRAKRLLPALFVALAAIMVLSMIHVAVLDVDLGKQIVATIFYQRNTYALYFGGRAGGALVQMWSLSIEEQFYLVFPIVFLLLMRFIGRRAVWVFALLGLGSFALAVKVASANSFHAYSVLYFSTPTRAFELLAGVVLAFVVTSRPVSRLRSNPRSTQLGRAVGSAGMVGLIGLLWLWHVAGIDPFKRMPWLMMLNAAATVAVIAACLGTGLASRALSVRPLRWVGKVSYGAYVYHVAIFFILSADLLHPRGLAGRWLFMFGRVAVVLVAAGLSYRYIEAPLRYRKTPSGWRLWAAYGSVAVALSVVAMLLPFPSGGLGARKTEAQKINDYASAEAPRVWLAGDGLAEADRPGLLRFGRQNLGAYTLNVATASTCPLLGMGTVGLDGQPRATSGSCGSFWFASQGIGRVMKHGRMVPATGGTVVLQMGTADLLDRVLPDGSVGHLGQPAFDAFARLQLGRRAGDLANLSRAGVHVVWVTLPDDPRVVKMNQLGATDATVKATAAQRAALAEAAPPSQAEVRARIARFNDLLRQAAHRDPGITVTEGFDGGSAAWQALLRLGHGS